MEVNLASALAAAQPASTPELQDGPGEVNQDTFLQLLVAQLEHQDPLSPMDNIEFTAQLAQFRSLEQLETVNSTLTALTNLQGVTNNTQAASFIGKEIKAQGDTIQLEGGVPTPLRYELPTNSARVTISISDASGRLVRTLEAVDQPAGEQTVLWDGRDTQGNTISDGRYRFDVSALDQSGNAVLAKTLIQGIVDGVEYGENALTLLVEGNRVELSSLISVHREENTTVNVQATETQPEQTV